MDRLTVISAGCQVRRLVNSAERFARREKSSFTLSEQGGGCLLCLRATLLNKLDLFPFLPPPPPEHLLESYLMTGADDEDAD